MFRSSTIIRELVLCLAEVMLEHSVKLCPYRLCGGVAWRVCCVLCFSLCSVDRASRYIRVMTTNLMHYLSSVYSVNQPLHVLGISVAHHQEV
jgi:hypothetical protein